MKYKILNNEVIKNVWKKKRRGKEKKNYFHEKNDFSDLIDLLDSLNIIPLNIVYVQNPKKKKKVLTIHEVKSISPGEIRK